MFVIITQMLSFKELALTTQFLQSIGLNETNFSVDCDDNSAPVVLII